MSASDIPVIRDGFTPPVFASGGWSCLALASPSRGYVECRGFFGRALEQTYGIAMSVNNRPVCYRSQPWA